MALTHVIGTGVLTRPHHDADFDRIASVTGQRCEWVVAAGSAD